MPIVLAWDIPDLSLPLEHSTQLGGPAKVERDATLRALTQARALVLACYLAKVCGALGKHLGRLRHFICARVAVFDPRGIREGDLDAVLVGVTFVCLVVGRTFFTRRPKRELQRASPAGIAWCGLQLAKWRGCCDGEVRPGAGCVDRRCRGYLC